MPILTSKLLGKRQLLTSRQTWGLADYGRSGKGWMVFCKAILLITRLVTSNAKTISSAHFIGNLCFSFSICLFTYLPAGAQYTNLRFEHLTVEDGLPNSNVFAITQDQRGFIWIGTSNGLCRYDGYEFKTYKQRSEEWGSISDNTILRLTVSHDSTLWIGTLNGGLNHFDPVSEQFENFQFDSTDENSLSDNAVFSLYEDRARNLWVGTRTGGLNRLDRSTGKFYHYQHHPADTTSISDNFIRAIFEDQQGILWIGTHGGLNRYDPNTEAFTSYRAEEGNANSLSLDWVGSVCADKFGMIWAGTINGLNRLDPEKRQITQFWPNQSDSKDPFSLSSHRITSLMLDDDQNLWIGTETGGINRLDSENGHFYASEFSPDRSESLLNNHINTLFQDKEGTIWVGTPSGISRLKATLQNFTVYGHEPNKPNSLSSNTINGIWEDKLGNLWIATMDGGLNYFDRQTQQFQNFLDKESPLYLLGGNRITTVIEGLNGDLWVGTYGAGLIWYKHSTKQLIRYRHYPSNRNFIFSLFLDSTGQLWFGSAGGLNRFDLETKEADYFPYAPEDPTSRMSSMVSCIYEDSKKHFWVGTNIYGLKLFNRKTESFEHYRHDPDNQQSLSHNTINDVLEDREGRLWVATGGGGLNQFFPEKGTFVPYREEDGLPDDVIWDMAEDASGQLWLSTGQKLSKFDPISKHFRNYNPTDGLPSYELGPILASRRTGEMYLGSAKGVVIFHPDSIQDSSEPPPIVITKMIRYNTQLANGLPIETSIATGQELVKLTHKDDILTFEFAALSYLKSPKNQYAYRLEGFNDQWIPLGTKRDVSFTDLDPGNYVLHVKACNGDEVWNEAGTSLKITIIPPWYWAWWSKGIYAILIVCGLYWLYQNQLNRRLATLETIRLRELNDLKTKLYTNITHEFRTPLTVISGMADQVITDPQSWFREGLQMIKRNSGRLLTLVNQMLELRKLEAGTSKVKMIQGDIIPYLRYLSESFHSFAESRAIQLDFESEQEILLMDFDPDKMAMIVSNLLSNAIKFTPTEGQVQFIVDGSESPAGNRLQLMVKDSGIGISEEKLPYIFDRFYQGDDVSTRKAEGTGIGLALTKELIHLLKGTIHVKSRIGEGTTFIVSLPINNKAPRGETWEPDTRQPREQEAWIAPMLPEVTQRIDGEAPTTTQTGDLPSILIIEDNPDVVQYLNACLEKDYRVGVAYDGRQGVEKALETVPDLIISDVMMPEMDGFEVCLTLKKDTRSSHIPIILLTARADLDSRLAGLERGADVYLAKPFEKEELLVRIRKLLELRRQLQQHYLALSGIKEEWIVNYPSVEKEEQEFLKQLRSLLEDHLADPQYSVAQICKDIGMSKSQLHRKLNALTGMPPSRFLRSLRLAKAQVLLENSFLSISEIADECGFQDPGYFARIFRQHFGQSPRDYQQSNTPDT